MSDKKNRIKDLLGDEILKEEWMPETDDEVSHMVDRSVLILSTIAGTLGYKQYIVDGKDREALTHAVEFFLGSAIVNSDKDPRNFRLVYCHSMSLLLGLIVNDLAEFKAP